MYVGGYYRRYDLLESDKNRAAIAKKVDLWATEQKFTKKLANLLSSEFNKYGEALGP